MQNGQLVTLFDFENREAIFPDVHRQARFCLLTFGASRSPRPATFVFLAHSVADLSDDERKVTMTYEDVCLVNPTTKTSPTFLNRREARVVFDVYRTLPPFFDSWPYRTKPGLFNMAGDSALFSPSDTVGGEFLPLYEGKMVGFFDHRAADVIISSRARLRQGQSQEITAKEHEDPSRRSQARYFVPAREVDERLRTEWSHNWLLGWKEVTSATNERTLIPCVLPRVGVGHKIHLIVPAEEVAPLAPALLACLSSFIVDFVCRRKLSSTSLTPFVVRQLPVIGSAYFAETKCGWASTGIYEWLEPRVLELCYTSWDLAAFATEFGYACPPFKWDVERRALLRAELDAAFFHLYDLARADVDYVLDAFTIVRDRDVKEHGEYRTKRLILEIYDELAEAIDRRAPYQTRLDPPPADPRVTHPSPHEVTFVS
jgi:hypothetical protein